jgi:PiT family inorganic phosphate transporter
VVGFVCAALLLLVLKALVKTPALYQEPKGNAAPPGWIRGLLILTCGGVSFAHGSNDGQKGMGLIMLILIGTVPTAYALNHAMPQAQMVPFIAMASTTERSLQKYATAPVPTDPRATLATYVRTHSWNDSLVPALAAVTGNIADQVRARGGFAHMPATAVTNVRNDMYLTSEAIRFIAKDPHSKAFDAETTSNLTAFKKQIDHATKFIPLWVKVVVAIALGLGTMVGWKRIVVTIGEKIGKTHLTYAQGASAELVAMSTIAAADMFGLPVSTTHVLSSGVAGTMAANHSGLQMSTVRNLVVAWVLTLPAAIILSGALYWIFRHVF